jgi:hypothetical protein
MERSRSWRGWQGVHTPGPGAGRSSAASQHSNAKKGGMPLTNMNTQDMQSLVAYIRSMPKSPEGQ